MAAGKKRSPLAEERIVAWLQTINVAVLFLIVAFWPRGGPIFWFFGGFFMLLVQLPTGAALLFIQLVQLYQHGRAGTLRRHARILLMPWAAIAIALSSLMIIDHWHLTEPFHDDHFRIRVELFPDGSCDIRFEGEIVGPRADYRYDTDDLHKGKTMCARRTQPPGKAFGHPHALIFFENTPGRHPIHDTHGGPTRNGGAYFDPDRGQRMTPSSSVYWDFAGGELRVIRPYAAPDRLPHIVVEAIGTRIFHGF